MYIYLHENKRIFQILSTPFKYNSNYQDVAFGPEFCAGGVAGIDACQGDSGTVKFLYR